MTFNEFKNKYERVSVDHFPNSVSEKPSVTVCIHSYNHGDYIEQCLDGILMQKTNFFFEILIGEDNSSDKTREICIKYAKKHPTQIRLFLHHRENNIKIDGKPTGKFNFYYNLYNAKGDYIAIIEGDDYWSHPLKLQAQHDFMEQNKNCSFCFHDSYHFTQATGHMKDINLSSKLRSTGIVKSEVIFKNLGGTFPTASSFFRRTLVSDLPKYFFIFSVGDSPLILKAISNGQIAFINEKWSVYRTTNTNWSSNQKVLKFKESHYKVSICGIEEFNKNTNGAYKKGVDISKSHLTYQLLYFYLTLEVPFINKWNYVFKHFGTLNLGEKIKILYRLISFLFK